MLRDDSLPANRSFRLRGVRITDAQETAYKNLWLKYGLSAQEDLNLAAVFPSYPMKIAEIGTGMGEATAQMLSAEPQTAFLCFEVHKPGIGALLAKIEELKLENVKLIEADARVFLAKHLPDSSLDGVRLFFPDPWPKRKHWKRRIVQEDFVDLIADKLKVGGHIHIATDWVEYANWIAKRFENNPRFSGGEIPKPEYRYLTKFEAQGIKKGHKVTDLWYVKL
jgi:tRNA (guanine-N7-)-methyltransferase